MRPALLRRSSSNQEEQIDDIESPVDFENGTLAIKTNNNQNIKGKTYLIKFM